MKAIIILFTLIMVANCSQTEVKEHFANEVSKNASKIIINELECSNTELVKTDVKFFVDRMFKLPVDETGVKLMMANEKSTASSKVIICKTISGSLVPVVVELGKAGKLTEWGCKVEKGEEFLTETIFKGCDKLAESEK